MSEVTLMCAGLSSLAEIPVESARSMTDAHTVNLHCNKLKSLAGMHSIISITSLNLSSNEFTTANLAELCLLPNLTVLDLAGNFIESLELFPFLPSLHTLSVAYNRIKNLEG
jgi:Leucine-rich repeat (LRR) protein